MVECLLDDALFDLADVDGMSVVDSDLTEAKCTADQRAKIHASTAVFEGLRSKSH